MDRYSRIVSLFKVLLPLAALAILCTLFLLSRSPDIDTAIPFAQQDIEDRLRGQQITRPQFSGVTSNGSEISVTADRANPGSPDSPPTAENLRARLTSLSGGVLTMTASKGALDFAAETARFAGDVEIASDAGLTLHSALMDVHLTGLSAHSPGPVTGASPMGDLNAGSMRLETKSQGGPVHMLFNNGVKLVYVPQKSER